MKMCSTLHLSFLSEYHSKFLLPYKQKDLEKEDADTIRSKVSLTLQNSKPPKDKLFKDKRKALKEYNLIHQLWFYQLTKVDLL